MLRVVDDLLLLVVRQWRLHNVSQSPSQHLVLLLHLAHLRAVHLITLLQLLDVLAQLDHLIMRRRQLSDLRLEARVLLLQLTQLLNRLLVFNLGGNNRKKKKLIARREKWSAKTANARRVSLRCDEFGSTGKALN